MVGNSFNLNLIYYKDILDLCFKRFFSEQNNMFKKNDDESYVYIGNQSKTNLEKLFSGYIRDILVDLFEKNGAPAFFQYYFIIGGCFPGNNILLDTLGKNDRNEMYFPAKFRKMIENFPDMKYFLTETDINIDMRMFNNVFENIFNHLFSNRIKTIKKWFGKNTEYLNNIFFIKHSKFDCYFLFKTIKQKYGSLCVNLHKKFNMASNMCIWSVNEKIDDYSRSKLECLNSESTDIYKNEILKFMEDCLNG